MQLRRFCWAPSSFELQPGPLLYEEHMDIVYNVFAAMIVANVAMLVVGAFGVRFFAKVIGIQEILIPIIFVLALRLLCHAPERL